MGYKYSGFAPKTLGDDMSWDTGMMASLVKISGRLTDRPTHELIWQIIKLHTQVCDSSTQISVRCCNSQTLDANDVKSSAYVTYNLNESYNPSQKIVNVVENYHHRYRHRTAASDIGTD